MVPNFVVLLVGFARARGIIGRTADRDSGILIDSELAKNDLEDIRRWLRLGTFSGKTVTSTKPAIAAIARDFCAEVLRHDPIMKRYQVLTIMYFVANSEGFRLLPDLRVRKLGFVGEPSVDGGHQPKLGNMTLIDRAEKAQMLAGFPEVL